MELWRTKIVAFKTLDISQDSVATHLRCVGIYSGSINTNCLLILIVKYLVKLRCTKLCQFLGHPVDGNLYRHCSTARVMTSWVKSFQLHIARSIEPLRVFDRSL